MADVLTPEQRRKNRQRIISNNTKIEVLLRNALLKKEYRFRKNYKELLGESDIVFTKNKIAILCDGQLFQGKDLQVLKTRLEKAVIAKIELVKLEIYRGMMIIKITSVFGGRQ